MQIELFNYHKQLMPMNKYKVITNSIEVKVIALISLLLKPFHYICFNYFEKGNVLITLKC